MKCCLSNVLWYLFVINWNVCGDQYDDIALQMSKTASRFKRDFTVLDLTGDRDLTLRLVGCCLGCDFTYVVFCDENHFAAYNKQVIALEKKMYTNYFEKLARSADFDIAIIPANLIKEVDPACLQYLNQLAWITIFLTNDNRQQDFLKQQYGAEVVETTANMVVVTTRADKILCKDKVRFYLVNRSFVAKYLIKKKSNTVERVAWCKGITLCTYLFFGGFYPVKKTIECELYKNFSFSYTDYMPWNIVIQGQHIVPIDQLFGPAKSKADKLRCLRATLYSLYNKHDNFFDLPRNLQWELNMSLLSAKRRMKKQRVSPACRARI